MHRLPGRLLNATRTASQRLRGRNAFDEALAADRARLLGEAGGGPREVLQLRHLSSSLLWLGACSRAGVASWVAITRRDADEVQARLAHFAGLLRLGNQLAALGILRLRRLRKAYWVLADVGFHILARVGLNKGLIVLGKTRGITAARPHVRADLPQIRLADQEQVHRAKYSAALQECFAGTQHMCFRDVELEGLPESSVEILAGASWRKDDNKLRIGLETTTHVLLFCEERETRSIVLEAYHSQFSSLGVHDAALGLLRTRRELAQSLGFSTWAE